MRDIKIDIKSVKRNKKSISVTYTNNAKRRFAKGKKYHHASMFSNKEGTGSKTHFNTRFRKMLSQYWLDDVISQVTSECYAAITAAAPVKTGQYKRHISLKSPAINKYLKPGTKRIVSGTIFIRPGIVPNSNITYADLGRFLEFGTGAFEITGAGHRRKNRFGERYGMQPQPHWIPNYEIYKRVLVERVREELKRL